ncbi:hypothetical protein ACVW0Y_004441 [Pseudomonas sp. TE3786]
MDMRLALLRSLTALSLITALASSPLRAEIFSVVYRVDTRPPAEVFAYGFSGGGNNTNLLEHVFDASCDADDAASRSAWVSTTGKYKAARNFARARYHQQGPGTPGIWLYRIVPDESFVSIDDALRQVIHAGQNSQLGYTPLHAELIEQLQTSASPDARFEVVTRRIAPQNIRSATYFASPAALADDQAVALVPFELNPNFRQPTTAMTDEFVLPSLISPASIRFYQSEQSCSLACDGASARTARKRRSVLLDGLNCAAEPNAARALIGSEDD